jgi:hypothetical protein
MALTNIQTNKTAKLKQLDKDYVNWDKAKKSFGYIGITFLSVLFGSIFANDFIKLCVYYYREFRQRRRNNDNNNNNNQLEQIEDEQHRIQLDQMYADELEERLERVYFRLKKANANKRINKKSLKKL